MFHESAEHSLLVVDYVACRNDVGRRGLLLGKLFAQVQARATSVGIRSVIFEMEDPAALSGDARDRAQARLRRFASFGARRIGNVSYVAPNMEEFGSGGESPYLLMHIANGLAPETLTRARVQTFVRFLYRVWYRNWFSRRYDAREAELRVYVDALYERVAGDSAALPDRLPLQVPPSR